MEQEQGRDPAQRVRAPALALMAAGGMSALATVLWLVVAALLGAAALGERSSRDALPGVGVMVALGVVRIVLDAFVVFAAWEMLRLRNWTVCLAGAIVAILPCSFCCFVGVPLAIWPLAVLLRDADVRRAMVATH
ncbi:MAG: hypothetical protein U0893_18195 [Chloroflexota bacterium]